jgi:hypothetical protein
MEVRQDVLYRLDAHGEPHEVGRGAGGGLVDLGQPRVGGRSLDGRAPDVIHIGQMTEQLEIRFD